jgi:alanine-glyoxylate transaminase/serine-glyoxylate transaminase/serine-pyruvate transaminase
MAGMVNVPQRVLMGPGPSDVPARVLSAMARPTIGHLDPVFLKLMDQVREDLRFVFRTRNELTMAMSGTGSAGMETVLANLVEPGDRVVVAINGVFGQRMKDVAERCGAKVETIELPFGRAFEQGAVVDAIDRFDRVDVFGIVHAETSTGVFNPVDRIGEAVRRRGGLFVLDCVTSLAGMPVEIDAWGVDAAYSGTQKCLSCPPGLSPVTFSPRAVERLERRKQRVQSWYLDVSMIRNYWGQERAYHHTAPVNMLYALAEALEMVREEGLEQRWARHRAAHDELKAGLAEMGIAYVSDAGHTLPMLNAIGIPAGAEDVPVRRRLLEEYGIEIGGGLGPFKGKAWRVGLMGEGASRRNVTTLLGALERILK